jgi:hypothetical protein
MQYSARRSPATAAAAAAASGRAWRYRLKCFGSLRSPDSSTHGPASTARSQRAAPAIPGHAGSAGCCQGRTRVARVARIPLVAVPLAQEQEGEGGGGKNTVYGHEQKQTRLVVQGQHLRSHVRLQLGALRSRLALSDNRASTGTTLPGRQQRARQPCSYALRDNRAQLAKEHCAAHLIHKPRSDQRRHQASQQQHQAGVYPQVILRLFISPCERLGVKHAPRALTATCLRSLTRIPATPAVRGASAGLWQACGVPSTRTRSHCAAAGGPQRGAGHGHACWPARPAPQLGYCPACHDRPMALEKSLPLITMSPSAVLSKTEYAWPAAEDRVEERVWADFHKSTVV